MNTIKAFIFYCTPWTLIAITLPILLPIALLSWLVFKILGIDLDTD